MSPIVPRRIVGLAVLAEEHPIAPGAPRVYRGVDLGPGAEEVASGPAAGAVDGDGPYRARSAFAAPPAPAPAAVIVRDATQAAAEEAEYLAVFEKAAAARHRLSEGPAPRLLHTLGRGSAVLVTVEEHLVGAPLPLLIAPPRRRGEPFPASVALAIAKGLLPLWIAAERWDMRFRLDPAAVLVDRHGEVRARPDHGEKRGLAPPGEGAGVQGSPAPYSSPEEIRGEEGSVRSGMFTLGLIVYEMLAGSHPLASPGTSVFDLLSRMAWHEMPPLRRRRKDLPPAVTAFVHRCLERDPARRFESLQELAAACAGVQALLPPAGPAEVTAYLQKVIRPGERERAPEIGALDGWRHLPSQGLRAVPLPASLVGEPPQRDAIAPESTAIQGPPVVSAGRDGRPMVAVSPTLLVDVRPVTRAELERFFVATAEPRPAHLPAVSAATGEEACVYVPVEVAESYARWAGKRLPTEKEWDEAVVALGASRLGTGAVWEWTTTIYEDGGCVIRGGRWRDQVAMAPRPRNRSFAICAAPDLGFRCVADAVGAGRR